MEINKIYNENCFETMKKMPDKFVDLIVTSPPYNEEKKYDEYKDNLKLNEWLDFIKLFLKESRRILKDDGRICLNLSESGRSPLIPKPHLVSSVMYEMGFLMRANIIWIKPGYNGCAWGSWCSPSNPSVTDNSEYIIVASNKKMKKQGLSKNIDIMGDEFKEWITGHWIISPSSSKEHPCIFPIELVKRCLKLYSFKNDLVYDPFMGSGTTAVACILYDRNYIGSEISEKYCILSKDKVRNAYGDKPKIMVNLENKNNKNKTNIKKSKIEINPFVKK